jgi:DsbC/DsbD-like thiol-disulfide interchange protein
MNRRNLLKFLGLAPFAGTTLAAQTWSAKFMRGAFNGTSHEAGLYVQLDEGWKTYWRNPGEAGIPPSITATADNLAELKIDFPLPTRIIDDSGEAIGFHKEVLFPFYLTPKDVGKPIEANLSAFFGVCQQICQPAKLETRLNFELTSAPTEQALLSAWQARVPKAGTIANATIVSDGNLVIDLVQKLDDLFVEGPEQFYFRKPDFNKQAGKAWIKIDGLKNPADLRGVDLRMTGTMQEQGLEQRVKLA